MLHQSTEYQSTSNIIQQKIIYKDVIQCRGTNKLTQRKTINALDTALSFDPESCLINRYLQNKPLDCLCGKEGTRVCKVKQTTGQSWDWCENS